MRAFQISEPGDRSVLSYTTEQRAPVPAPGQLLIQVAFAGLNFTDVLARRGAPGYAAAWPFVPGMEVAGTVAALGSGVEGYAKGDAVAAFVPDGGGFADLVAAEAALTALLPAGLDLATAAGMPLTWTTALGLVHRAAPQAGENVLVTSAAGGVGAALAAALDGAEPGLVVGGIGSAEKQPGLSPRYVAVPRGADFYADATSSAGGLFDVILDSVGGDVLVEAAANLSVGGRLVSYGAAAGQPDPSTPAYPALRAGNQTLSGFSILRLARTAPGRAGALIRDVFADTRLTAAVPSPRVVEWDGLLDAHLVQSEGRAIGKTVVRLPTASKASTE